MSNDTKNIRKVNHWSKFAAFKNHEIKLNNIENQSAPTKVDIKDGKVLVLLKKVRHVNFNINGFTLIFSGQRYWLLDRGISDSAGEAIWNLFILLEKEKRGIACLVVMQLKEQRNIPKS